LNEAEAEALCWWIVEQARAAELCITDNGTSREHPFHIKSSAVDRQDDIALIKSA
jgi:hypothetical protein